MAEGIGSSTQSTGTLDEDSRRSVTSQQVNQTQPNRYPPKSPRSPRSPASTTTTTTIETATAATTTTLTGTVSVVSDSG